MCEKSHRFAVGLACCLVALAPGASAQPVDAQCVPDYAERVSEPEHIDFTRTEIAGGDVTLAIDTELTRRLITWAFHRYRDRFLIDRELRGFRVGHYTLHRVRLVGLPPAVALDPGGAITLSVPFTGRVWVNRGAVLPVDLRFQIPFRIAAEVGERVVRRLELVAPGVDVELRVSGPGGFGARAGEALSALADAVAVGAEAALLQHLRAIRLPLPEITGRFASVVNPALAELSEAVFDVTARSVARPVAGQPFVFATANLSPLDAPWRAVDPDFVDNAELLGLEATDIPRFDAPAAFAERFAHDPIVHGHDANISISTPFFEHMLEAAIDAGAIGLSADEFAISQLAVDYTGIDHSSCRNGYVAPRGREPWLVVSGRARARKWGFPLCFDFRTETTLQVVGGALHFVVRRASASGCNFISDVADFFVGGMIDGMLVANGNIRLLQHEHGHPGSWMFRVGAAGEEAVVRDRFRLRLPVTISPPVAERSDADRDGLVDAVELRLGTDEHRADSDGDGVDDRREFEELLTDPANADSDGDGVLDGDDDCPLVADCELDGVFDPLRLDLDGDGVPETSDNCPGIFNPDQRDGSGDGVGDRCDVDDIGNCRDEEGRRFADQDGNGVCDLDDPDDDADGIPDGLDNCPLAYNPDQLDIDFDGRGWVCDPDDDGDGIDQIAADGTPVDNCPTRANADQADLDGDGIGDACDHDIDADGVGDVTLSCPVHATPEAEPGCSDVVEGEACVTDTECAPGWLCIADVCQRRLERDNCPRTPNPGQGDNDGDGVGDACDDDDDDDGVPDRVDGCPLEPDADQVDLDGDGAGDACDDDDDGDGVDDDSDLCPRVPDPQQSDLDGDQAGDACDPDRDGDLVPDDEDNCPDDWNHFAQDSAGDDDFCADFDSDEDGIEDLDDNCPRDANRGQADVDGDGIGDACDLDGDNDGLTDDDDNCPTRWNPRQDDLDGDGQGDACEVDRCAPGEPSVGPDQDGDGVDDPCDADVDGDGAPNALDGCPRTPDADQLDSDGDGIGDACEADRDGDGVDDIVDNCIAAYNPAQADRDLDGIGDTCEGRPPPQQAQPAPVEQPAARRVPGGCTVVGVAAPTGSGFWPGVLFVMLCIGRGRRVAGRLGLLAILALGGCDDGSGNSGVVEPTDAAADALGAPAHAVPRIEFVAPNSDDILAQAEVTFVLDAAHVNDVVLQIDGSPHPVERIAENRVTATVNLANGRHDAIALGVGRGGVVSDQVVFHVDTTAAVLSPTLDPAAPRVGDPVEVGCGVGGAAVEFSPRGIAESGGDHWVFVRPGPAAVTCRRAGETASIAVDVAPGPPATLRLLVQRRSGHLGYRIPFEVIGRDRFGNPADTSQASISSDPRGIRGVENLLLLPEALPPAADGSRQRIVEFTLRAHLDRVESHPVELLVVDAGLEVEHPPPLASVGPGPLTVSGTSFGLNSVVVDDTLAVMGDGRWSATIPTVPGVNFVRIRGVDAQHGTVFETRRDLVAGPFDDAPSELQDALRLRIGRGGLDDIAAHLASALDAHDWRATLTAMPEDGALAVDVESVRTGPARLRLEPEANEHGIVVRGFELPEVHLSLIVRLDDEAFPVEVRVRQLLARLVIGLEVRPDDRVLTVQLRSAAAEVRGVSVVWEGGQAEAPELDALLSGYLVGALESRLAPLLTETLSEALEGLTRLQIPLFEDGPTLDLDLTSVDIDPQGVSFAFSSPASPVVPAPGPVRVAPAPPRMGEIRGVAVVIQKNLLNRIAYHTWLANPEFDQGDMPLVLQQPPTIPYQTGPFVARVANLDAFIDRGAVTFTARIGADIELTAAAVDGDSLSIAGQPRRMHFELLDGEVAGGLVDFEIIREAQNIDAQVQAFIDDYFSRGWSIPLPTMNAEVADILLELESRDIEFDEQAGGDYWLVFEGQFHGPE